MTTTSLEKPQITRVSSINRHGDPITKAFRSREAAMVEVHFLKLRGHQRVRVEAEPAQV
jgi:hypothetical protein